MMSEIEKLYENVNVYKMLCNCEFKNLYDYSIEYGSDVCDYTESKIKEPCKVCEKAKQKIKYYPEFTAEKQLNLIKCLLTKVIDTEHIHLEFSDRTFKFFIHSVACSGDDCDTLENALCSYINNLWQDLTDTQKAEIKRILE